MIKFEPYAQPITPTRATQFPTNQSDAMVAESATPTTTSGLGTTIPSSVGSDHGDRGLKVNVWVDFLVYFTIAYGFIKSLAVGTYSPANVHVDMSYHHAKFSNCSIDHDNTLDVLQIRHCYYTQLYLHLPIFITTPIYFFDWQLCFFTRDILSTKFTVQWTEWRTITL